MDGKLIEYISDYFKIYINRKEDNIKSIISILPEKYPAYLMALNGEIGAVIPSEQNVQIDETFSGCRIYSHNYPQIGNSIALTTKKKDYEQLEVFIPICAQFVWTGEEGEERNRITSNPFDWYDKIRKTWGTSNRHKSPSDLLAELYSLHLAHLKNYKPKWEGPDGNLVDIRGNNIDIEVKSTTHIENTEITIGRELQLDKTEKDLHLYFVSMQKSEGGISINDLVETLVTVDGMSRTDLETKLSKRGLSEGKAARRDKYVIVKVWDFNIDEDFPKITPESFKDCRMPDHITKVQYTIDISGLDYKNLLGVVNND